MQLTHSSLLLNNESQYADNKYIVNSNQIFYYTLMMIVKIDFSEGKQDVLVQE